MEDVLEIDHRPYDIKHPVICLDEQPRQLVKEIRIPLAAKPGQPESFDFEYERNGTANIFLFTEPLSGWRKVVVTEHRTAIDWAKEINSKRSEGYATKGIDSFSLSRFEVTIASSRSSELIAVGIKDGVEIPCL
jgi:hypothetical protein